MNPLYESMKKTFADALELSTKKNADYASVGDPYKNFRLVETLGICSIEQAILVRLSDKLSRIVNLIEKNPEVLDEKITDTILDGIVYLAILRAYLDRK